MERVCFAENRPLNNAHEKMTFAENSMHIFILTLALSQRARERSIYFTITMFSIKFFRCALEFWCNKNQDVSSRCQLDWRMSQLRATRSREPRHQCPVCSARFQLFFSSSVQHHLAIVEVFICIRIAGPELRHFLKFCDGVQLFASLVLVLGGTTTLDFVSDNSTTARITKLLPLWRSTIKNATCWPSSSRLQKNRSSCSPPCSPARHF